MTKKLKICPKCKGEGWYERDKFWTAFCYYCLGKGYVEDEKCLKNPKE
jgi:DnaJ-class molecular chaperone